jgi:hypothetical protein
MKPLRIQEGVAPRSMSCKNYRTDTYKTSRDTTFKQGDSDDKSSTSAGTLRPGRYGELRIGARTSAKSEEDQYKIRPGGWIYPTDL